MTIRSAAVMWLITMVWACLWTLLRNVCHQPLPYFNGATICVGCRKFEVTVCDFCMVLILLVDGVIAFYCAAHLQIHAGYPWAVVFVCVAWWNVFEAMVYLFHFHRKEVR